MALDIVGPANAPNSTTIRPADTRTFGATDTWAKDCSSPTANDGTKIQAGWLNGWMGQLRNLVRGNGQTAASADIVTQDNSDDSMALKAIQHLIQRGLPKYGVDTGAANTLVVSLSPALAEYKAGLVVHVLVNKSSTSASTINFNGLGAKSITHVDGAALVADDLVGGELAMLGYDGTKFQKLGIQAGILSANTTYFVNGTTGSDTLYNGLSATVSGSAGPFATIQKAVNVVAKLNANGFGVTVNVAAGTYAPFIVSTQINGTLSIVGVPGSPATCVITTSAGTCVASNGAGVIFSLNGFKVVNSSAASAHGLLCQAGGTINFLNIDFGACVAGAHIFCDAGLASCFGNYTISGNATFHALVGSGGRYIATPSSPNTVTLSGGPGFVTAYQASDLSVIRFSGTVFSGAATAGARYSASGNGVINTGGSGASYLPGITAGSVSTGGQYI
jgi:hypothetical protein